MTEAEAIAALAEGFARGLARAFATAPLQPVRAKRGRRPNRTPHSRPGTPAAAPPLVEQPELLGFDVPPILRPEQLEEMEAVLMGKVPSGVYEPGEGTGAGQGVT